MKDKWTLIVEQILYVIAKAERWKTIEYGMKALRTVNRMEEDLREEQRKLQNSNEDSEGNE